ncbi:hypothetical protein [Streptomyces inhibens]|uniref:hypothetical protein n=1 Tax=Streptomyces inhibens TaxID=2293571 RepID=UPI001EE77EA9|nr:hypothetical protein [Streptomyces inhibens]UKY47767.1 hypothetical protein KI385_02230 [Streptomyces inhibens]
MTVHDVHTAHTAHTPRISTTSDGSPLELPPSEPLHRAIFAARRTLRDAAVAPTDLDAIIYVVQRRQVPLRWQSARVAYALGAREDVAAFDVPGARAARSMATALSTPDEPVRQVLVIDAEGAGQPSASLISN